MVELVLINVAGLVLLAVVSRGEGVSYLRTRERVREALREANRVDADAGGSATIGKDAALEGLEIRVEPPTFGVGVEALGELCADGAATAALRVLSASASDVTPPAEPVAAVLRLARLEERLDARAAAVAERVKAVTGWTVDVRGS